MWAGLVLEAVVLAEEELTAMEDGVDWSGVGRCRGCRAMVYVGRRGVGRGSVGSRAVGRDGVRVSRVEKWYL